MSHADPVLEIRNVAKQYGQITALTGVNIQMYAGEIVALLGDNGAGKSTLMNIMCGALPPSSGEVLVRGEPITSLHHAQEMGIGMVYQDLALAHHLTVAENMFLGRELRSPGLAGTLGWLDRVSMDRKAEEEIAHLGISTLRDVRMPVRLLSGGQRQVAAIARALMWSKAALLLDEPTAALGPKQVALVLETIKTIAAKGMAVCLIAHDIPSVLAIADRLIILRRGRIVRTLPAAGQTVTSVVSMMVGENDDAAAA